MGKTGGVKTTVAVPQINSTNPLEEEGEPDGDHDDAQYRFSHHGSEKEVLGQEAQDKSNDKRDEQSQDERDIPSCRR